MLQIRIRQIHIFLGLLDPYPDPLDRGMDPDPDPSITSKNSKKTLKNYVNVPSKSYELKNLKKISFLLAS